MIRTTWTPTLTEGGPNGGASLWQARTNFLQFGACEEVAKQHARRPTPDEPRVRHWSLLEGVAGELIPATDVSPWNLRHDGTVVGLKRVGERVAMTVGIPYLRTRFDVPGVGFVLELMGGPEMEYAPYEGGAITSLDEIAKAEPDIVEAKEEDGRVVLWGSAGVLRLRYRDLALAFNNGAPLTLAALDECARAYWDEGEKATKR